MRKRLRKAGFWLPLIALAGLSGCGPQGHASGLEALRVEADVKDPARVSVHLTGSLARALRDRLDGDLNATAAEPHFFLALEQRPDVPVLARLEAVGEELRLTPQAPLTRGQRYVAVFRGAGLPGKGGALRREFLVPEDRRPSTSEVREIYPRLPELPANVFRFYVWFSEPMAEGHVHKHLRLLDEGGKPVPRAFHEVELWAEDHRRLTLWLSPGRTKEALGISEHSGPVLMPARSYTLEIGAGLPDRQGRPLARAFRYVFRTSAPDHRQPEIGSWRVEAPRSGTRRPLTVHFPEPLDRPLADRLLTVTAGGESLPGEGAVSRDGRSWSFAPAAAWSNVPHSVEAGGELDDLAGNSLYRPFETTAGTAPRPTVDAPVFRRPFRPR